MMKLALAALLLILLASAALAGEGKPVSCTGGSEMVNGILYAPHGNGPFPAIIVIHEYRGLNDWVKEQAEKLADQGYVAPAIDFYRGKAGTNPDEARQIMRGLPEDRVNSDLLAACTYLRSQKNLNPARVGAMGWRMGDGYLRDQAIAKLKAAMINYGRLTTDDARPQKINADILGILGGQDKGITPTHGNKFESGMKAPGKTVDIHIFPDAAPAFQNANNKQTYRADDTAQAWKLTTAFLEKYLRE